MLLRGSCNICDTHRSPSVLLISLPPSSPIPDTLVPAITTINATIASVVDLHDVAANVACIDDGAAAALPDTSALLSFIDSAQTKIWDVTNASAVLLDAIDNTTSVLTDITTDVDALAQHLNVLDTGVRSIIRLASAVNANLTKLGTYQTRLTDVTTGISAVSADLTTASTSLPTEATANACVSGSASLDTITTNVQAMSGQANAASRTALYNKLDGIATSLASTPNLTVTADNMVALSSTVTTPRSSRLIEDIYNRVVAINASAQGLPLAALSSDVAGIQSLLATVPIAGIRAALVSLQGELDPASLPDFGVPIRELNKINAVTGLLACVGHLLDAASALNASLVQLPSAFNSIPETFQSANASFISVQSTVMAQQGQLQNLNSSLLSLPNMSTYIDQVDNLASQVTNPPINLTDVIASIDSASNQRSSVDIASIVSHLISFNTSLWDHGLDVDSTIVTNLRSLQPRLEQMAADISTAKTDLNTFSNYLRCVGTNTVCGTPGSTAAPCSAMAPCEGGYPKCETDWNTQCSQDSDCNSGACPFHIISFATVSGELQGYVSTGPDSITTSLSTAASNMAAAESAINAAPAPSTFTATLTSLTASLQSVPISGYLSDVDSLRGQVDPSGLGLSTPSSLINTALAAVTSLDLGGISSQLLGFNSTLAGVKGQLNLVHDARTMVDGVVSLLYTTIPAALPALSRSSLNAAHASGGLAGLLNQVTTTADSIMAAAGAATSMTSISSMNLTSMMSSFIKPINSLDDDHIAEAGPAYFFMSVAGMDTVSVAEVIAAGGGDVFADADGNAWSSDRKCVTRACIESTIDKYNRLPLSTSGMGVPLSREQIFLVPFAIPLLIALMALLPAVCFFGKRWHRCPLGCSAFWTCVVVPWMFIFAGALCFPIIMLLSDGCRGGFNVGYDYVAGSERAICHVLPGGQYLPAVAGVRGASTCALQIPGVPLPQDGAPPPSIEIAIADLYLALLGRCDDYGTSLSSVYDSIGSTVATLPSSVANSTLTSFTKPDSPIIIRQRMIDVISTVLDNAGGTAGTFVSELGDALSCPAISSSINVIVDAFCCDVSTALFWWVSSWYLLAFTLACCGFPAAILGYKRIPNALWGPEAARRLEELGLVLPTSAKDQKDAKAKRQSIELTKAGAAGAKDKVIEDGDNSAASRPGSASARGSAIDNTGDIDIQVGRATGSPPATPIAARPAVQSTTSTSGKADMGIDLQDPTSNSPVVATAPSVPHPPSSASGGARHRAMPSAPVPAGIRMASIGGRPMSLQPMAMHHGQHPHMMTGNFGQGLQQQQQFVQVASMNPYQMPMAQQVVLATPQPLMQGYSLGSPMHMQMQIGSAGPGSLAAVNASISAARQRRQSSNFGVQQDFQAQQQMDGNVNSSV